MVMESLGPKHKMIQKPNAGTAGQCRNHPDVIAEHRNESPDSNEERGDIYRRPFRDQQPYPPEMQRLYCAKDGVQ